MHSMRAGLSFLSTYLVVAEAASFDKKELCRSDTEGEVHHAIVLRHSLSGELYQSFGHGLQV